MATRQEKTDIELIKSYIQDAMIALSTAETALDSLLFDRASLDLSWACIWSESAIAKINEGKE